MQKRYKQDYLDDGRTLLPLVVTIRQVSYTHLSHPRSFCVYEVYHAFVQKMDYNTSLRGVGALP